MLVGRSCRLIALCSALLAYAGTTAPGQEAGMKAIRADKLRMHLGFVASDDHYPFTRMGIPSVPLFAGVTSDHHKPADTIECIDFNRLEKIAQFAYAAALEIGNRPGLLKLDANPGVTLRGKQNVEVKSLR